ncbi:calcium-binding protein [Palleronia sp. LCG004]|uniref:calcium-binding protein n=1 Tax=Palleronia sp. LCG004 TaxID=3079304 RepID=UPI0029422DC6|nr:calcium-binding protein [Palleronia sp. LCG004]WOI56916.1 calcium-binding protein [Palleronia sp. LCG004]
MAHLDASYDSFATFLTPDDAPWSLEGAWTVDLNALNSSGVSGSVVLGMSTEADGSPVLNVSIAAEGLTPNENHPQHIHGRFDGDGAPINSVSPTIADDADRDGIVEVLEGVGRYGDVILTLINSSGNAPYADENGKIAFFNNYDLSDMANLVSPVTGTQYTMEDLMPLFLREVVLHGIDIPEGIGEGTDGEVNGGENGFVPIVPAAAGEIETATVEEALNVLATQRALSSDMIQLGDGDVDTFGGAGDDTIFGGAGDNEIYGGGDSDQLFGFGGDDTVGGGLGDDLVGGGAGDDIVYGGSGNDTVFGGAGNDDVSGGAGDDMVYGGAGNDILYGAIGDDLVIGGSGNDTLYGGAGSDVLNGGTGDDVLYSGPDDDQTNAADDGASGALTLDQYDNGYAGGAGDDTIYGGAGDDIITGDDDSRVSAEGGAEFDPDADGADVIYGGDGNDEIHTGTWLDSDDGFDNSQTGMADDFASGGNGDDILRGAGGNDTLMGDAGNDNIGGGGGDDMIYGGTGDDFVFGQAGADTFVHAGDASDGLDTVDDYAIAEGDVLMIEAAASEDDFTFAMDGDTLSVSVEGTQIFTLNGYDGEGVSIMTADSEFTYL